MQCELSVLVHDCVARIRAALKADHDVCGISEGIGDLALSLISPVCSYHCFYHGFRLPLWPPGGRKRCLISVSRPYAQTCPVYCLRAYK